ncbi:MAG: hypothetical protein ACRDSP_18890 [Pseudonocardiaceae bacterium]
MLRILDAAQPLNGLAGDLRDEFEILVDVQHGQPGEFGRRGIGADWSASQRQRIF